MSQLTNAQLATKVAELVTAWESHLDEFSKWVAGDPEEGPFADGRFPLTPFNGSPRYLPSPAALAAKAESALVSAQLRDANALTAVEEAEQIEAQVNQTATTVQTNKVDAETAKVQAAQSAANAATAAANAAGQAWLELQQLITVDTVAPTGGTWELVDAIYRDADGKLRFVIS